MSESVVTNSEARQAWVIHNGQDHFFTSTLCKALEGYGFTVEKTLSTRDTQRLLEKAQGVDLVIADEELLPVSGTSLVQRMPRLGVYALTAVIAHKIIPTSRVPLAFRRPIDAKEVARQLCENFASLAVTQGLGRVAEFFKLPVAELAWVVGLDRTSGKASVRVAANPNESVLINSPAAGALIKGQVVQLSAQGEVVKIVHDPRVPNSPVKSAA